jgi:hypothetical protein
MKQDVYSIVTGKQSVPANESGTGTIQTFRKAVVGTGTLFTTEMPVGSYLVKLDTWELQRVYRVDSDTLAYLDNAFSVDIAFLNVPQIIAAWDAKAKSISLAIDSTNPSGYLNNVPFTGILNIEKTGNDRSSFRDNINPVIIDGTGTQIKVNILY